MKIWQYTGAVNSFSAANTIRCGGKWGIPLLVISVKNSQSKKLKSFGQIKKNLLGMSLAKQIYFEYQN